MSKVRNTTFYFAFKYQKNNEGFEETLKKNLTNAIGEDQIKVFNVTYTYRNDQYHVCIWISHYKNIKIKKSNINQWFNIEECDLKVYHNKRLKIEDIIN